MWLSNLGVSAFAEVLRFELRTRRHETCVMEPLVTMRPSEKHRYRIIAASLRPDDVAGADRIVEALRDEGWPHANRSLVIREALSGLSEALKDRSPEEIFRHFIERRARRLPVGGKPDTSG
jgi:hypothetical protein